MNRRPALYEELAGPVEPVATAFGLSFRRGHSLAPCPLCGAEQRGSHDTRGPLSLWSEGERWHCHRCNEDGDAAALVAAVVTGKAKPTGADEWALVRAHAEAAGLVAAPGGPVRRPEAAARVRPLAAHEAPPVRRERPRAEPAELAAVWDSCEPVTSGMSAWLDGRGLDTEGVWVLDAARWLPPGPGRLPAWAALGNVSWSRGWRCLLRTWDERGRFVGLRARWTGDERPPHPYEGAKEVGGTGLRGGGAVYACPVGRWLLAQGTDALPGALAVQTARPWRGDEVPLGWRWDGRVLIVEGGPAWLRYASDPARVTDGPAKGTPAVFGVWSGAWTAAHGGRLAAVQNVAVATDDDEGGDKLAEAVAATLESWRRVNKRGAR